MRTHNLRTTPTRLWTFGLAFILIFTLFGNPASPAFAAETLSIIPITWNVIGLDSNSPASGPNRFPVGARICNEGTTDAMNVSSTFYWDSTDPYIDLTPNSISAYTGDLATPLLSAGECVDHYYEVTVTRTKDAYEHTREYHITADSDNFASVSTPANRELFVEHLVSQNRNSTTSLWMGETEASMTEITLGGSIDLVVGQDYYMLLNAQTAPGGYNNAETFVSLSNTIFAINSVQATYSQTDPKIDPSLLYADSCGWDNDLSSPTYRSCIVDDGKTGGTLSILYHLTVISAADSSAALNTLIYDFSGSSYHYNSDFSSPTVVFNTVTETNFSKSFAPTSIFSGDVSTLTFDIENVTASTITNVSFTDDLPIGLTVASPANETLSPECLGTPTTSASGSTISVSGLELAGATTCQYSVDVTSASADKYNNISANLFLDGVDTGMNATADLIVADAVAGTGCTTTTLAEYQFATLANGGSLSNPTPTSYALPSQPTAALGAGLKIYSADPTQDHTVSPAGTVAWGSQGTNSGFTQKGDLDPTQQTYFEFVLDTTDLETFSISYYAAALNGGPTVATLYTFPEGELATDNAALYTSSITAVSGGGVWTNGSYSYDLTKVTPDVNLSGNTVVRIYVSNAGADNAGVGDGFLDDVVFTGCGVLQPSLTKAFDPELVKQGDNSTLTLTLTNPNGYDLTGSTFSDELPTGVEATSFNTTCTGGDLSTSTASVITLTGATIPASSSCTVTVGTTVTGNGALENISGPLTTTETGSATTPPATATVTAGVDPLFSKQFIPDSIYEGESTVLRFTITNPNELDLTGVTFNDVLPTGLTLTADTPANTCGGSLTAVVDTDTISLSGGAILAKDNCSIEVGINGTTADTYANITGNLTTDQNTDPVTATDDLVIRALTPGIALLKQVSTSASGPWTSFVSVDPALSASVYYRFTIENIGDTDLSDVTLNDPTIDLSTCALATPFTLTTADPIQTCVVGPVTAEYGSNPNTATVSGTYGAEQVSDISNASYLGFTPGDGPSLQLLKQVSKSATGPWSSIIDGVFPGDDVYYRFLVTNDGNSAVSITAISDDLLSGVDLTSCSLSTPLAAGSSTSCVYGPVTSAEGITVNTANVGYTDGLLDYSTDSNAAVYPAGTADIGGTVWNDANRDINIDPSELGLQNQLLQLYQDVNDDGVIDSGDILIGQTYTDSNGGYLFANVPISGTITYNYLVVVTDPSALEYVGSNKTTSTQGSQQIIDLQVFAADSLDNDFAYAAAVTTTADLIVSKTNNTADTVAVGVPFTWVITATNQGADSVVFSNGQAIISDTLSASATYGAISVSTTGVSMTGSVTCSIVTSTLTCIADGSDVTIPTDASIRVELVATPSGSGSIANVAVVDPDSVVDEADETNNSSSSSTVTVTDVSPDLSVSKTDSLDGASIEVGNAFTWTITVSNSAAAPAYFAENDMILSDSLPANATYANLQTLELTNITNVANLDCSIKLDELTCSAVGGPVSLGASASLVISFEATPTAGGSLVNTALVDPNEVVTESDETNNSSTNTVDVTETIYDLSISKTDSVSQIEYGATATYTILVTNTGTETISGAVVTDAAIDGFTKTSTTCSATPGQCLSAPTISDLEGAGSVLPDLTAGATFEFEVTGTVSATTGNLINIAVVSMPDGITDATPADNTDSDSNEVLYFGLSLNKFVTSNTYSALGQVVTYYYTLTNESNVSIYAPFTISDDKFVSDLVCAAPGDVLAVGASVTCEQDHVITSDDITAESITNTAQATAYNAQTGGELITSNNDSVTVTYLDTTVYDLKIVKSDGVSQIDHGASVTYTIKVSNKGTGTISGAVVTDPAVDGLSKTATACSGTPGVCLSAPSIADLEGAGALLPDLAVGEFFEFEVTATVTASTGDVLNTAIVTMPEGLTDDNPTNNFATDSDEVLYYGLSLNKFVVGSTYSSAGQVITYHYTLTNESNTTLFAPFTISDDKFGSDLTCTAVDGMISVGEVLLCEQDYAITSADVTAGSVTNTAQATAYDAQSGGSVVTSNTDSVTITYVQPAPEPEPTPTDGSAAFTKQVSSDGVNWYDSISLDAGRTIYYRIQLSNTGSVALTNIVVNDNMSACALSQPVGDTDADGALDTNETWAYSCALAAEVGLHTNVATVTAPQLPEPLSDNATYTGVVINVFDPPTVIKYMTAAGLPEVETRMVWINNGNTTAINVQVTDAIPAGSVYVPGSLTCAPFGASVTAYAASAPLSPSAVPSSACGYDAVANRIQWQGNIAPDFGVTSEQYANNKVVITFRVSLLPQTNAITNIAQGVVDADNDGSFSDEDQLPTSSVDSNNIIFNRFQDHTLPVTGFDPSVITKLPEQPAEMNYADIGMILEIPSLNIKAPVMLVPQGVDTWDVTWLGDSMVGWLDGTAFPTHEGNTVLTGHVLDENNDPGPFNRIKDLNEGDSFYIHAWGSVYEYQVRKNKLHLATTEVEKVFKEAEGDWVTLVTCEIWNPFTRDFVSRRVVSAELVSVK